jgi:3,4-dihydroxy 2-butanone 4-phosphate synthase/GTP cyclohydrolase II
MKKIMRKIENKHKYLNEVKEQRALDWYKQWVAISIMKLLLKEEGEKMIEELGRAPLPTEFGDWTYITFGDITSGLHHEVLVFGNINNTDLSGKDEAILVRMHSSCRTNETYHAVNCECRKELHFAMRSIQKEGNGMIIYLEQEGRGTGVAGKMAQLDGMFEWVDGNIEQRRDEITGKRIDTDRAYKEAGFPSECRDFSVAGEMMKHLGVKKVRLLTNNPDKIKGIEDCGIQVIPVSIHIKPDNEIIASDLKSKALNLGHNITENEWLYKEKQK